MDGEIQKYPTIIVYAPKYDQPLHDRLKANYGKINARVVIEDVLPNVRTGNLQATVYDLTANKIWTANARAKGESGARNAYERAFVELDMQEVFRRAKCYHADMMAREDLNPELRMEMIEGQTNSGLAPAPRAGHPAIPANFGMRVRVSSVQCLLFR